MTPAAAPIAALLALAAQIPPAPTPLDVDRASAPVELTISFKLGEESRSRVRVTFDGTSRGRAAHERHVLGLDFDPLEGARWSWSGGSDLSLSASAVLTHVPEPKGLEYRMRVVLPPDGGIEIALADGSPILAATTPRSEVVAISFESDGSVLGLAVSPPRTIGDPAMAAALARCPRNERRDNSSLGGSPPPPTWRRAAVEESSSLPLPTAVELDSRNNAEETIERVTLELAEDVRVPVLVVTPARREGDRAALVVAGGELGKAGPDALARIAALAAQGKRVVAFDLPGRGERSTLQPFDRLEDRELLLVGRSPFDLAAREVGQVAAWARTRLGVQASELELWVDVEANQVLRAAGNPGLGATEPPQEAGVSPSRLLVEAATFGLELVRPRYDSWFLNDVADARELVAPPDRSVPLAQRIVTADHARCFENELRSRHAVLVASAAAGVHVWWAEPDASPWKRAQPRPPAGATVTLCASEFGAAAALHATVAARPPAGGDWFAAFEDEPRDLFGFDPAGGLERRVARVEVLLARLARWDERPHKVRLFGEGTSGVAMLLAAALHPDLVESVTTLRSIPSFELLLRRPYDAVRAPQQLGVLTQGMPADLFLPNALSRFELEECVLLLRQHGVAVDWREPIDALRRPLSRHDRLAMWPRVRHAEAAR